MLNVARQDDMIVVRRPDRLRRSQGRGCIYINLLVLLAFHIILKTSDLKPLNLVELIEQPKLKIKPVTIQSPEKWILNAVWDHPQAAAQNVRAAGVPLPHPGVE